jgi:CRP-like cAMP-binding protein
MESKPVHQQLLRSHHLFSSLKPAEMESLLRGAKLQRLEKDKTLFWQGDEAEHFYFVITGSVKLYRLPPDGSEKIIEVISANQSFAEAIMFMSRKKFVVTAQAIQPTQLFCFRNQDYLDLIKSNSELAIAVLGTMSMRLHKRIVEIETLSLKNAAHRVVRYLLAQAYEAEGDQPSFEIPVTKRLAAAQLSIQPETFSRIIHKLDDEDIIRLDGKQVTIMDRERLQDYE